MKMCEKLARQDEEKKLKVPFFIFIDFGIFIYIYLLLWHSTEAVAFFHSPSLPLFSMLALLSRHLLRDSLCTALQTEKLWI